MSPLVKFLLVLAALAGFSGIALAAIGAHAVEADGFETWRSWQAASAMHLLHAPALLALAGLASQFPTRLWGLSAGLMALGLVLFSGSIYYSILSDTGSAGVVAPIGGVCMMLGWLLLMLAPFRVRQPGLFR